MAVDVATSSDVQFKASKTPKGHEIISQCEDGRGAHETDFLSSEEYLEPDVIAMLGALKRAVLWKAQTPCPLTRGKEVARLSKCNFTFDQFDEMYGV